MILSVVTFILTLLPTLPSISDVHKSKYDRNEYINRQIAADLKKSVQQLLRHPLGEGDVSRETQEEVELITPLNDGYKDGIVRLGITTTREATTRPTTTKKTTTTTTESVFKQHANVFKETESETPLPFPANPLSDEVMIATLMKEQGLLKKHKHRGNKKKKKHEEQTELATTAKSVDIFYRRLTEDEARDLPLRWVHCHDVITPYLVTSDDHHQAGNVGPKDKIVSRLVHLISLNTTTLTNEEVMGVRHQISMISIDLFHWETKAIRLLFAAICKGRKHSFRALKNGVLKLFAKWKVSTNNASVLLTKSQIIHPPCMNSITLNGSLKSSPGTTYTTHGQETNTSSKFADDEVKNNNPDDPITLAVEAANQGG